MTKKSETLKEEIEKLIQERDSLALKINNLNGKIDLKTDEYFESSDNYVKIKCPNCGGRGYVQNQETGKKIVCKGCNTKGYIWLEKFEESKASDN